ncbi:MAG: hypothetical protein QXX08_10460, partial [Candidatus Bathyarchaeia archaeon]
WLNGWAAGKNILKGSLTIDIPEIKVVEVCFNEKLILIGVGTAQHQEKEKPAEKGIEPTASKSEPNIKWKIFYNKTTFSLS